MTALAVLYAALAVLGLKMDAVAGFATLVWPPTGLSLAALLLFGQNLWPGVALGALGANLWIGASPPVAVGIAIGNTLEAVLGAAALRRIPGFRLSLDRLADVLGLIVLAAVLSTLVSALLGVTSLRLGGIIGSAELLQTGRAWWVGDLVGDLLVAPLMLTWWASRSLDLRPRRLVETIVLGGMLLAVASWVFGTGPAERRFLHTQAYLVFPVLIWAALRFGQRGAVTASFVVSAIAVWGTARHRGPFGEGALGEGLLFLQTFMAVVIATMMILSAVMAERTRAVQSRDEFLGVVSHDLKNMLHIISLSAAWLQRRLPDSALHSPIRRIKHSVDRMNRLIGDLRDVAAMESGRLTIERKRCSLGALLQEAAEMAKPLAADKEQTVVLDTRSSDLEVMADQERLLQVLANLTGNAIKFTPEGGAITIGVEQRGTEVLFTVTDTGPGIERDHLRHVFERYWQAKGRAQGGSGLGLSIAREIVLAHGGRIWAESEVGEGSRLLFTLPLSP